MKEYILISLNLILTIALLLTVYDTNKEDLPVTANMECLDFQGVGKSLCAQCVSRIDSLNPSKGFTVKSEHKYAGLKLLQKTEFINCKESLQLIDSTNVASPSLVFEKVQAITELLQFLEASVITQRSGKVVVEPKYEHFIIYGWYNTTQKKGVEITFPNDNSNSIHTLFEYLLNAIIAVVVISKIFIKEQIGNEYLNYSIIALVVGLQYLVYSYAKLQQSYFLLIVRVISLSIPLLRVQVKNSFILGYGLAGLIMGLHRLSLSIYSYFGWLLVLVVGYEKLKVEKVWRYLIFSQLLVSVNYLIWYFAFHYEADTASRIIELTQLSVNLLAFSLIGDRKVESFKEYIQTGRKKPQYLSGYEEETEMIIIS